MLDSIYSTGHYSLTMCAAKKYSEQRQCTDSKKVRMKRFPLSLLTCLSPHTLGAALPFLRKTSKESFPVLRLHIPFRPNSAVKTFDLRKSEEHFFIIHGFFGVCLLDTSAELRDLRVEEFPPRTVIF